MSAHKKRRSAGSIVAAAFGNFFRFIAALIMVMIITGCIVASVLTVYILRYINADEQITLDDVTMKYTSIIYAGDEIDPETGLPKELQQLQTAENRIPIKDYSEIPKHMVDALVAIEDKRFWEHHGVDWKRTIGATVNLFLPSRASFGGSTITQQLIKNITGDDDYRIERKVQEIFRALKLEQHYSKEQIVTAYLNVVFFSNHAYGAKAAANTYFAKDLSELSLAECASIIAITNYPTYYNPLLYPEHNKDRQEDILWEMLDQGRITQKEYEDAINEELVFHTEVAQAQVSPVYSYFVDHVIEEVIDDLMNEYGYTYETAQQMVNGGGLRIYTTIDTQMQDWVTQYYSDAANFPAVGNATYPQSACVITDPNGKVLAMAGGIGEKKGMREFNRATGMPRQCGSSIKPIAAYLQAIENDIVTWSTKLDDTPVKSSAKAAGGEEENDEESLKNLVGWPVNHYRTYLGPITIDEAIQRSTNTIPVKLVELVTPRKVFDFLHDKLGMDSLVDRYVSNGVVFSDVDLFPMALGGLTNGVSPLEMAGAYQIFANGGYFTKPYSYTQVLDATGDLILEKDTTPRRVISEETSTIINKLMQRVTGGPYGTGTTARFQQVQGIPVAGKTGTTDDDRDQWFMGVTPYYVTAVWLGFDTPERITYYSYPPPIIYRQLMEPLHQNLEPKDFPISDLVEEKTYCVESGGIAGGECTTVATGWYKKSYDGGPCNAMHGSSSINLDDDDRSTVKRPNRRKTRSGLNIIDNDD